MCNVIICKVVLQSAPQAKKNTKLEPHSKSETLEIIILEFIDVTKNISDPKCVLFFIYFAPWGLPFSFMAFLYTELPISRHLSSLGDAKIYINFIYPK